MVHKTPQIMNWDESPFSQFMTIPTYFDEYCNVLSRTYVYEHVANMNLNTSADFSLRQYPITQILDLTRNSQVSA